MRIVLRWIAAALAFAMPAYLALVAALIVHGAFAPWAPARDALQGARGARLALQVGIASQSARSPARGLELHKSRFYLLWPQVLTEPALVKVTQVDRGPVRVTRSRGGFFAFLAAVLLCVVGSAWLWFAFRREPSEAA